MDRVRSPYRCVLAVAEWRKLPGRLIRSLTMDFSVCYPKQIPAGPEKANGAACSSRLGGQEMESGERSVLSGRAAAANPACGGHDLPDGLHYYFPCQVRNRVVAVLGLGKNEMARVTAR